MRPSLIILGALACFIFCADAHRHKGKRSKVVSSGSSVSAVKKSETTTTQTHTLVEEEIEETVVTNQWQSYFITSFSNWHSLELKSLELKEKVSACFSQSINGQTYWEKVSKNQQYLEFLAASTGYSGNFKDAVKVKEHCVQIAASKPRLLALAFKSITKNMVNTDEKLIVSKLAKSKYQIGEKVIEVKKDWKQFAISNFLNIKSNEGNSKELINKVTTCLNYDSAYFDKFIQKKIYAEYLAYATGYTGDIKKYQELKNYLKTTSKSKPRLVALALKYLAKNLKNPKVYLGISPIAIKKFGIKEKQLTKVDWKTHLINEYYNYKSTQKYKEADQRLRVSSMLKFEADGTTILDLILKRKDYKEFFAKSLGYSYSESSFNEKDFREYIKTTSELYPTLVSLSFRSICKNLKSNEKLIIAPSAEKIIKEKIVNKSSTETRKSKKITKKTITTTTTRTWEEYIISEFAEFKSLSEDSSEVKVKVNNFLNYKTNIFENLLKKESYAEYLAYTCGYKGDYKDVTKFSQYLRTVGQTKPRLLASSLKHVTKNIQNSAETLVVSKAATQNFNVQQKTFNTETKSTKSSQSKCSSAKSSQSKTSTSTKVKWASYAIKNFADWKTTEDKSHFLKAKLSKLVKLETGGVTYLDKILSTSKYAEYFAKSTGFTGDYKNTQVFKDYINKIIVEKPRLVACSIKYIALNQADSNKALQISNVAKTRFEIGKTVTQSTETNNSKSKKSKKSNKSTSTSSSSTTSSTTTYKSYLTKYFQDVTESSRKSNELVSIIENFRVAENGAILEKILNEKQYYNYLVSVTKYSGQDNVSEFRNYLQNEFFKNRPRFTALALKQILLNIDGSAQLVSPTYCTNYWKNEQTKSSQTKSSKKSKKTSSSTTSTSSASSTSSVSSYKSYLQQYFNEITETSRKSNELVSVIENFRVAENGAVLEKILNEKQYYNYLVSVTKYSGQDNVSEFRNYLQNEFFKKRPRFTALAFKQILLNIDGSAQLVSPTYCNNYWKTEATKSSQSSKKNKKSSSTTSSSSVSTSSSISSYKSYLNRYFSDITETSRKSNELVSVIENFRVAENGAVLEEILKNKQTYNYLVSVTKYSGQDNISEFRNFLQNEFFKKRPRFTALAFKQILLNIDGSASLVAPAYCTNYWKTQGSAKSFSETSSKSTSSSSSSSSSSVSKSTVSYLRNFVDIKSASSEKSKISTIVADFARGSNLDEILKEEAFAKYLAATLEYTESYKSEAFKSYIKKTILKERPLALALSLKRIFNYINQQEELVIPAYVSNKYNISHSGYSVSKSSSYSKSYSTSSSSTSSSSASGSAVHTEGAYQGGNDSSSSEED